MKKKTENQLVKTVIETETADIANRRTAKLKSKILTILDGTTDTTQIGQKMSCFDKFFKSIKSEDFCLLLESVECAEPVYIVLWYHAAATMNKATKKCALFSKDRMLLLYPLWRLYADEAEDYL